MRGDIFVVLCYPIGLVLTHLCHFSWLEVQQVSHKYIPFILSHIYTEHLYILAPSCIQYSQTLKIFIVTLPIKHHHLQPSQAIQFSIQWIIIISLLAFNPLNMTWVGWRCWIADISITLYCTLLLQILGVRITQYETIWTEVCQPLYSIIDKM